MPGSAAVAAWQARLDRDFPYGAIAAWDDDSTVTYLIPRITVTGCRGLDPEIILPVFAGSNKVLGPFRVLSRTVLPGGGPHAERLVLGNVDAPLLISSAVSTDAARAMAADRAMFTAAAPRGGPYYAGRG